MSRCAVLAVIALLSACQNNKPCQLRSHYEQMTEHVGKAELTFTPNGPGHFLVRQTGFTNFMGMATFSEGMLRVVFQTANGYGGTYTWELDPTCTTGKGRLDLDTGGTGTHQSTLTAVD